MVARRKECFRSRDQPIDEKILLNGLTPLADRRPCTLAFCWDGSHYDASGGGSDPSTLESSAEVALQIALVAPTGLPAKKGLIRVWCKLDDDKKILEGNRLPQDLGVGKAVGKWKKILSDMYALKVKLNGRKVLHDTLQQVIDTLEFRPSSTEANEAVPRDPNGYADIGLLAESTLDESPIAESTMDGADEGFLSDTVKCKCSRCKSCKRVASQLVAAIPPPPPRPLSPQNRASQPSRSLPSVCNHGRTMPQLCPECIEGRPVVTKVTCSHDSDSDAIPIPNA